MESSLAGADISLAVDRSGTATNGNLYLTWQDGGNLQVPSFGFFPDTYNFSDVLVSRSPQGRRELLFILDH